MIKHLCNANTKITEIDNKCIQPNAVDIRVSGFSKINTTEKFILSEYDKTHRSVDVINPVDDNFYLDTGIYEFMTNHYVEISDNECGIIVQRSTLNRNGIYITSGIWDSGFKGYVAGVIHITGPVIITKNTRIAQFVIFESDMVGLYNGSYGINGDLQTRYNNKAV